MITQIQGNFNSTPAMGLKRTELKVGKIFPKNWKLKGWHIAFCTIPSTDPQATHSSPPSQPQYNLQPPPKPKQRGSTRPQNLDLLQNLIFSSTAEQHSHSSSKPTYILTCYSCSSHPLHRHRSMEVISTLELVTPA